MGLSALSKAIALILTFFLISCSNDGDSGTHTISPDSIYREINQSLSRHTNTAAEMANNQELLRWLQAEETHKEAIEEYLQRIAAIEDVFTSFLISEKSRRYYHPNRQYRKISPENLGDAWYFRARRETGNYDVIVSEDESNAGVSSVFINHRIFSDNGDFLGITGVGLSLNTVQQLIDHYRTQYRRNVYITDPVGHVMFFGADYKNPLSLSDNPVLKPYLATLLTPGNTSIQYENNGKTILLDSRHIAAFDWYLMIEHQQ